MRHSIHRINELNPARINRHDTSVSYPQENNTEYERNKLQEKHCFDLTLTVAIESISSECKSYVNFLKRNLKGI